MVDRPLRRYVALGDSFTEGLHDVRPDGTMRGWADRVAAVLAQTEPDFHYANLALRSLRVDAIVTDQVPAAVGMRPDLVTLAAGGNDILGLRTDVERAARQMRAAVATLAGTGAVVVLFGGFDPRPHLPPGRFMVARTDAFNRRLAEIALDHDALFVDLWSMPELRDPLLWSPDRLHLSAAGHLHVAGTVLDLLDRPTPAGWPVAVGERAGASRLRSGVGTLGWGGEHLLPWAVRKLRNRPAARGRAAKHTALVRWTETD